MGSVQVRMARQGEEHDGGVTFGDDKALLYGLHSARVHMDSICGWGGAARVLTCHFD